MRGNRFGKLFSITSFGESHGEAMGAIVDGVPANINFSKEELQKFIDRRRPNKNYMTDRNEPDNAEILSGVFEGKTLGTPICVVVKNIKQKSSDYKRLKNEFRPGHADRTTLLKYGIRDHRGGGRSSGRETLSRVIAGYFAQLIIPEVKLITKILEIGSLDLEGEDFGFESEQVSKYLDGIKKNCESVGGRISLTVKKCPSGLGEPVFDKLKADLAKAFLSIGGCVSFEYGRGREFSNLMGSEIVKSVANFGGMEGGISNGLDLYIELVFKAPSTVGENAKEGRHDPCIIPRVVPVVESMALITIADHFLRQNAYNREGM